jgi:hypothetical protein
MAPLIGLASGGRVHDGEGLVHFGRWRRPRLSYSTPQRQPCVPNPEDTRRRSGLAYPSEILPA